MTKVILGDVANLNDTTTAKNVINNNSAIIETAFDNTLSRDGTSPNTMAAPIDMNSNRVLNLVAPVNGTEPLRLIDASILNGGGTIATFPSGGTTGQVLGKNSNTDFDTGWKNSVTSVGLALPTDFTVTGSPVTTTGTLTGAWVTPPTGTGAVVRATSPTIATATLTSPTMTTPALGIPASGVATNLTGTAAGLTAGNVTTNANLTGDVTSVGNATTLTNAPVIAKVLTGYVSGAGTVSATDTILQAFQKLNGNDATNANLTGPITSVGNATSIASQTGTGTKFVVDTSPTLVTPILGAATATSINKLAITAPASAATLTIPDGVTLTGPAASGTAMTLGNTETVTGVKTFGSAGAVGRLQIAGTTSGTTILDATAAASGTLTLPAATDTLVCKATTDTFTNKTFDTAGVGNSLSINGVAATANTGTGSVVRATSPSLVTPALGTPASGVLTNCTGTASGLTAGTVTTNANLTGQVTSVGNATTIGTNYRYFNVPIVIDGGGSVISTGIKGDTCVDVTGTIDRVTMLADQTGSIVVDIWKQTYASYPAVVGNSITAAAIPTISSAIKSQDSTLTGWTTTVTAGDTLRFNVNSVTTITRVTLILRILRT